MSSVYPFAGLLQNIRNRRPPLGRKTNRDRHRTRAGRRPAFETLETRLLLTATIVQVDGPLDELANVADAAATFPATRTGTIGDGDIQYEARLLYVTADGAPTGGTHTTTPGVPAFGVNVDGVAYLRIVRDDGTFRCSGSLLSTGQHIMTVGHCLADDNGNLVTTEVKATWELSGGDVTMTATNISDFYVHPLYDGEFLEIGKDIAIIALPAVVDTAVPRYEVYRDSTSELNQQVVKVGYGKSGHGDTGGLLDTGTKRAGLNVWDGDATLFERSGQSEARNGTEQLIFDFDNGLSANDAADFWFQLAELGLYDDEVISAAGDSGGPSLIADLSDGGKFKIAGITSYGVTFRRRGGPAFLPETADVDDTLNSSFGEFGADTRVQAFLPFIDSVLAMFNAPPIAEPDAAETDEDISILIDLFGNDSDPEGDTLSVVDLSQGTFGTVFPVGGGTANYLPDQDSNGVDSFTYTVSDESGATTIGTVTVTVNPVNDDPVADDDVATTRRGLPVMVEVLANDSDVDSDMLSVSAVSQGGFGAVLDNGDGTVTYTPGDQFSGSDTFTYTTSDGDLTDTATVTVAVNPVNGQVELNSFGEIYFQADTPQSFDTLGGVGSELPLGWSATFGEVTTGLVTQAMPVTDTVVPGVYSAGVNAGDSDRTLAVGKVNSDAASTLQWWGKLTGTNDMHTVVLQSRVEAWLGDASVADGPGEAAFIVRLEFDPLGDGNYSTAHVFNDGLPITTGLVLAPGSLDGNGAAGTTFASGLVELAAPIPAGSDIRVTFDSKSVGATQGYIFGVDDMLLRVVAPGDTDADGVVDSSDMFNIFAAGKFNHPEAGSASWAEGDFNGDTLVDSSDVFLILAGGHFNQGPYSQSEPVPQDDLSTTPTTSSAIISTTSDSLTATDYAADARIDVFGTSFTAAISPEPNAKTLLLAQLEHERLSTIEAPPEPVPPVEAAPTIGAPQERPPVAAQPVDIEAVDHVMSGLRGPSTARRLFGDPSADRLREALLEELAAAI